MHLNDYCMMMLDRRKRLQPVFWASLNGVTPTKAETGQTLAKTGSVTYQTYKGIPCAYLPANAYIDVTNGFSGMVFPSEMTISFWAYKTNTGTRAYFGWHDTGSVSVNTNANRQWLAFGATDVTTVTTGAWHHMLATASDSYAKADYWLDGTHKGQSTRAERPLVDVEVDDAVIGDNIARAYHSGPVYMAGLRIYDRVLTPAEITTLANEFHPTA